MYSIVTAALWMSVERSSTITIELGTVETRLDVQRRTGTDASQHYFGPALPCLPCPATMLPRCEEQVRLYSIAATRAGRVGRWETAWGGSSRHAVPVILFRLWPSPWPCGLWSLVDADWRVSRTAHASEVLCCPS